jgi:adenylate kinase
MNILIMGAAGSGKGTMAEKIIEKFNIPHISTGNMFRANIYAKTPLGLEAKTYIDGGHLVPDEVTINMIQERLLEQDCQKGYLVDGFPRTLAQAMAFEDITSKIGKPIEAVINLQVELDDLAERVTGRRLCRKCGAIYHIKHHPSQVEGVCDICGGELFHRSDDTVEQLATRLKEHVLLTKPVLDFYRKKSLVHNVSASRPIEDVFASIDRILRKIP